MRNKDDFSQKMSFRKIERYLSVHVSSKIDSLIFCGIIATRLDGIFTICHERARETKKNQSPTRIEPMTSRTPIGRSNEWQARSYLLASYVITLNLI